MRFLNQIFNDVYVNRTYLEKESPIKTIGLILQGRTTHSQYMTCCFQISSNFLYYDQ
jgi:hypothetical protein